MLKSLTGVNGFWAENRHQRGWTGERCHAI